MTLPWSNTRFVMSFPCERQEYFFEGHLRAFEFFGGAPGRVIYDNLKAAVTKVLRGRRREVNAAFQDFCDHCLFTPSFCNCRSGNEKGSVESGVKWAQRTLMTPLPAFTDWRSFNERLSAQCRQALEKPSTNTGQSIGERLELQREHLRPLPCIAPQPMRARPARVDSQCLVHFDNNAYSVPCEYAHHDVTIEADVAEIRIYRDDNCVAVHERRHGTAAAVYNPLHYLPLIERKPRALDDGAPMKCLQLPECFEVLRRRMEDGQEHSEGTRAYIRVLRLLEQTTLTALTRAVERALELGAQRRMWSGTCCCARPNRRPRLWI